MPTINNINFKGLPGLNYLSEEERQTFMLNNDEKLKQFRSPGKRRKAAEILYNNQQFRDTLGDDLFNQMNDGSEEAYNLRNKYLKDFVVQKTFADNYKDDKNYNLLSSELDTQGMYDLMTNSDYLGTQERERRLKKGIETSKGVVKDYDAAINNPYTDALGAGFMQFGKTSAALTPFTQDEEYAKKDNEIQEKLFKETQERRENEVSDLTDTIYSSILANDNNGVKSLADSYKEFDNLATQSSNHYKTFKDSKWLKDYTDEDKLKDYAKYQALKEQYGERTALQYLDRSIQNRVADAQEGKWTGNTLKAIGTTVWSDLGSNIALFSHLGATPERLGILNEGKDPDKPIYDKQGNVVDYQDNESWLTNPAYWNDVYKYNTYSPTEIKAIKERGGISEDVNVREYGYTPDFLSWDTAQEGFKQFGHVAAGIIETGLTGGVGKGIGWGAKGAMKAVGLSTKAASKAAKVGAITNDLFVMATTGLEGAQLEAMGTFDEQMQSAREKIQDQIRHELYDYQQSIDYDSPEAQQAIGQYYQQLKQQDKRRTATQREGVTQLPLSDETLMAQAKQQYTNDLLTIKNQELEELHKKDEEEARKAATKAYGTNFIMDYIKNVPLTVGIQKFKVAKGATTGALDNILGKNIIADVETGGVKRAASRMTSGKNLAKELGKQLGGGFTDEYLDGVNASFASGIGNHEFDTYINKTYNPEAYNAVVDTYLGNMLSGLSEGIDGLTDRQNLYEGFIGAIAPVTMVGANPNAAFHPKDTWKAVVNGVDSRGNQLNFAERLSNVIMNPLLATYSDLAEQDRIIDSSIDAINNVVSANKEKLNDASKLLLTLDDYSSPVERDETSMLLDSKDKKLHNAFTLIGALNTLENMEGGANSQLYQDAMHTIEGLANGTLSEEEHAEEVDKFLADPDNKSILDQSNGREVAAERLQKNAQYFMDMKNKVQEIQDTFAKSSNLRNIPINVQDLLVQNLVATDDYKKRLEEIEEEAGVSKTDAESLYTPNLEARYGTSKARVQAAAARDRMVNDIQKLQEEALEDEKKAEEKIVSLKQNLKSTSDAAKQSELQQKINEQENLVASNKFKFVSLEDRKRLVQDELSSLQVLVGSDSKETEFTEESILNLDARDRAEVLNPDNSNNYSKKQQRVIEHVRKKLQKDPEAIQKLMDAGTLANRISDMQTVYSRILDNNALASTYLDAVEAIRTSNALAESLQRGIDEHYSKIDKAWNNRFGKNPRNVEGRQQEFRNAVMAASNDVVRAYVEDHPEQAKEIQPYLDLLDFEDDARSVVLSGDDSRENKLAQIVTLRNILGNSNSREEAQKHLEDIVDSPDIDEGIKNNINNLLSKLETVGYQRDAVVVENRKKRKEREEAEIQRKKKEEEDAKVAAAAAQVKAEEAAASQPQHPVNADGSNLQVPFEVAPIDQDMSNAVPQGEPSEETLSFDEEGNPVIESNKSEDSSVTNNVNNPIIDTGDSVHGKSATIDEQVAEPDNGKEAYSSEENTDYTAQNGIGEHVIETSAISLSGNAMSEWEPAPLQDDGILEHKHGEKPEDSMNRYFSWMNAAGIKLQNIIDQELGQILKQNPQAKVKFMVIRPEANATKDIDMKTHLMLVLDYDNSINKGITNIHNEDNGGVFESDGKKYLVIGTVGYGNRNNDKLVLYDILFSNNPNSTNGYGLVKRGQGEFFRNHPDERYYVHPTLETEIVPSSLIPGYIVKQLETDANPEYRSITELLSDPVRNPQGLEMSDLAFGIQEMTKFLVVGAPIDDVMVPRNVERNSGSAFVLIPASNGKMVPSYLKPLFYNEIKDGQLKNRIADLLNAVTAPDYATRYQALMDLTRIFHFSEDGDNILLGKDDGPLKNQITVKHGLETVGTFTLNENFDRQLFMKAIADMNPRVNITKSVLQSNILLQQYDEAGALQTDVSLLNTAGSSYSIYGLDAQGNILKPETVDNDAPNISRNNDFRNGDKTQVIFKHQYYIYDTNEGRYYLNGIPLVDESLIKNLDYNRRILESGISPVETSGVWKTYILGNEEHPEVVKIHKNTKEVQEMSEAEGIALIEKIEKDKQDKERAEAAEQSLKSAEDVDLGEESSMVIDENTGMLVMPTDSRSQASEEAQQEEKEKKGGEKETPAVQQNTETDMLHRSGAQLGNTDSSATTQTFNTLARSKRWRKQVREVLKTKWPDAPSNMVELEKFLKKKDVEVNAIGTSDADVNTWLETIKECR